MRRLVNEVVTIWTDGSCLENPGGAGGWAAIIGPVELAGNEPRTTNNRMELTAVLRGLDAVRPGSRIEVFSDSTYVVDGLNTWRHGWRENGWRRKRHPIPNADLWASLDAAVERHLSVTAFHVLGHNGAELNERADELAGLQARRVVATG